MPQERKLAGEVPGPGSRALEERRRKAVARGVATMTPVYAAAAHGAVIEDVDGNRFIDFTGGLGVLNAGHTPPSVTQAVKEQVERYLHTCQHAVMNEPYVAVAEALNRITPGDYDKRTMLVNSGAEATENVVKIARAATGRPGVVVFDNAFHGRTCSPSPVRQGHPYKQGYQPFPSEIFRCPTPYCRCLFHRPELRLACRICPGGDQGPRRPQNVACLIGAGQGEAASSPRHPAGWSDHRACRRPRSSWPTRSRRAGRRHPRTPSSTPVPTSPCRLCFDPASGLLSGCRGHRGGPTRPALAGLGGTYGGNPLPCASRHHRAVRAATANGPGGWPGAAARPASGTGSASRAKDGAELVTDRETMSDEAGHQPGVGRVCPQRPRSPGRDPTTSCGSRPLVMDEQLLSDGSTSSTSPLATASGVGQRWYPPQPMG
jgi:hypothetical protein